MEIYKKKISLENFISRTPSSVECVDNGFNKNIGSWGCIPKDIVILEDDYTTEITTIKYHTLMRLYYSLLSVIASALYYELDENGGKWIHKNHNIYDILTGEFNIQFRNDLPTKDLEDKMLIGLTSQNGLRIFYEDIKILPKTKNEDGVVYYENGFQVLKKIDEIIGKVYVPKEIDGIYVPKSLFKDEIPLLISKLEDISSNKDKWKTCCDKIKYEDYGGDDFLNFLKNIPLSYEPQNITFKEPTLDLHILLHSQTLNLGEFKQYDVDTVYEDITEEKTPTLDTERLDNLVKTTGVSKLHTLKKRKMSVDDNGIILPGIMVKNSNYLKIPYQTDYIKNIQNYNNEFYGDVIVSIKETCEPSEITIDEYNETINKLKYLELNYSIGTIDKPLVDKSFCSGVFKYGNLNCSNFQADMYVEQDLRYQIDMLKMELVRYLKDNYPSTYCLKHDYNFTYDLTYYKVELGIKDIVNETVSFSDTIYISYGNVNLEFIYVLGGKLKSEKDGILKLNEKPPYTLLNIMPFKGSGIWYRENYPVKKLCSDEFLINGVNIPLYYDVIQSNNVDYVTENHIICNDIRYKGDSYIDNCTHDEIFRDDKMLGLSLPLKEDYDVLINRGTSAAFERHLQLSEIKTMNDLEQYRNGYFLK